MRFVAGSVIFFLEKKKFGQNRSTMENSMMVKVMQFEAQVRKKVEEKRLVVSNKNPLLEMDIYLDITKASSACRLILNKNSFWKHVKAVDIYSIQGEKESYL